MKFKYVKEVVDKVLVYGQELKTGDVVEFNDWFSSKASKNPDFVAVEDQSTVKKQGRPAKSKE